MFRWLQSKIRQTDPDEANAEGRADDREYGPSPWTVRVDTGLEMRISAGRDIGRVVPLDLGFAVMGRTRSLRTVRAGWLDIGDATVSRRQAVLEWDAASRCYAVHHLQGATNVTRVDGRTGPRVDVRAGSTISVGILNAEVQRRSDAVNLSTYAQDTITRLGAKVTYDQFHGQDLALTVITDEGRGNTWLLNRGAHPLSASSQGRIDDLLTLHAPQDEVALLMWSDEAGYRVIGNAAAPGVVFLYKGQDEGRRPDRLFSAPRSAALEVDDGQAHVLHPGDVLQIGAHRVRLHVFGRALVEACVRHALSGRAVDELGAPDELLAGVAPAADAPDSPPPPVDDLEEAAPARPFMPFTGASAPPPSAGAPAPPRVPGGFGAPAPPPVPGAFGAPAPPPVPGAFGAPAPPPVPGAFGAPAPPPVPGGFGAPAPPPVPGGFGAPAPPRAGGFGVPAPPRVSGGFGAPPRPAEGEEESPRFQAGDPPGGRPRPRSRREGEDVPAGEPPAPSPRPGRTPRVNRPGFSGRDDVNDPSSSP